MCWELSRVAGDMEQQLDLYKRLDAWGVRLFDVKGHEYNTDDENVRTSDLIQGVLVDREVRILRGRVYDGLEERARVGQGLGRLPLGIDRKVVVNADGTHAKGLICEGDAMPAIRRMFRWSDEGKSDGQIAILNKRHGVRMKDTRIRKGPRKGEIIPGSAEWSRSQVGRTLETLLYRGWFVWNQRKTVRTRLAPGQKSRVEFRDPSEWIYARSPLGNLLASDPLACTWDPRNDTPCDCDGCGLWERVQAKREARRGEHDGSRKFPLACCPGWSCVTAVAGRWSPSDAVTP